MSNDFLIGWAVGLVFVLAVYGFVLVVQWVAKVNDLINKSEWWRDEQKQTARDFERTKWDLTDRVKALENKVKS